MTEPQFMAIAGPLLLYILGFLAVAMTIFVYVEFKDRMAKFQSHYRQQCEIDTLKKENQDLVSFKESVIAKIRTDLKSVKIA